MNASTTMVFRAVTQDFLQSNLPSDGEYTDYSCNITVLDVYAQKISLSDESNVFIESNNRSYSIGSNNARFLVEDTQNLLVGLRIGGYVHPYNPSAEFMFPEYVLYGFEHNYRAYASSLSASGQEVFSQMKSSAAASIFVGPAWALPTAILLAAAAVFFLASAFICCFFWKRNRRRQQKMEAARSNVEGNVPLADPGGEQPKPSVAFFPSEVSDALVLSEDDHGPTGKNRSSGYEPLPSSSTARKPRESNPFSESVIEQRPHGKNPFSDSFDTSEDEQQEEEAPLVQRWNFLETESRNEGIASASDDADNDIESRSTSSSNQVEDEGELLLKAPVSRAEESDNECVVQSTKSGQRESESISKSTSTVEDKKESTISKQKKDSSSSFSTSVDEEQEEGSKKYFSG